MILPFRDHHLLQFLESWKPSFFSSGQSWPQPLDRALYLYFRNHKSLGVRDREAIATTVYELVRWRATLDAWLQLNSPTWQQRLEALRQGALDQRKRLALAASVGMPEPLFQLLCESFDLPQALEIAETLQQNAPTALRVNTLKIDRSSLLEQLPSSWQAEPGEFPEAIIVQGRPALFQSPWFQAGLFEMQDEGSQHLASLVRAAPGELVFDYCAGSGGKSLAIATKMCGRGQLFLHDVRLRALEEAKARLCRAGIQNAQLLSPGHVQLKKLKKRCQWVLVDAPCSGSGTLRRNPDMKERIDRAFVEQLQGLQRSIFEKALSYLTSGGTIVYATCSLFRNENEEQVDHFCRTYDLELAQPACKLLVKPAGHDGFFAAALRKRATSR